MLYIYESLPEDIQKNTGTSREFIESALEKIIKKKKSINYSPNAQDAIDLIIQDFGNGRKIFSKSVIERANQLSAPEEEAEAASSPQANKSSSKRYYTSFIITI